MRPIANGNDFENYAFYGQSSQDENSDNIDLDSTLELESEEEVITTPTLLPRRSTRIRKQPTYLQDYELC